MRTLGIVDHKTYYYMPWHLVAGIFLLLCGGLLLVVGKIILCLIALLIASLVLTAHYGLQIDLDRKTYLDYFSILGMKSGETIPFIAIEYLFIKTSRMSHTANSLTSSRKFTDNFYDGYIKFGENEKIYLMSDKNKVVVMKVLEKFASSLALEIKDYTITDEEGSGSLQIEKTS